MCEWWLSHRARRWCGRIRGWLVLGFLCVAGVVAGLCVSGGWHFEGLVGWACVVFGLFAGFCVAAGVVWVVMCEWWLAHWRVGALNPAYV